MLQPAAPGRRRLGYDRADARTEPRETNVTPKKAGMLTGALVVAAALSWITAGPPEPSPAPSGTFSFAALGDTPYYPWEEIQYGLVQESLNAADLTWVIHVGDIFWHPCRDGNYIKAKERMDAIAHPVIYTPGDNEWADCWEPGSGEYAPLERLGKIREVFFADPRRSLGAVSMPVVTQADADSFSGFAENVRWTRENILFATVHMVGSWNGKSRFPGRTSRDDEAAEVRTRAACAWIHESFAEAEQTGADAVVLAFHANPGFEEPVENRYRQAYEPFLHVLEEETEAFEKPVLVIQGDDHEYLVDRPLHRRTTGKLLENFTRLQVPGSPRVGWVRVTVTPGSPPSFAFEESVIPPWKYW